MAFERVQKSREMPEFAGEGHVQVFLGDMLEVRPGLRPGSVGRPHAEGGQFGFIGQFADLEGQIGSVRQAHDEIADAVVQALDLSRQPALVLLLRGFDGSGVPLLAAGDQRLQLSGDDPFAGAESWRRRPRPPEGRGPRRWPGP